MGRQHRHTMSQAHSSNNNLLNCVHGGRPVNELPHVRKSPKKKQKKVDLILRVDLDSLSISDDEYDDLVCLFQLYDRDQDGILNTREMKKVLTCLGFRLSEEQVLSMARKVSCDHQGYSVSFNEFLTLVSKQRREEPDQYDLLGIFRSLDPKNSGEISLEKLRKIMKNKEGFT